MLYIVREKISAKFRKFNRFLHEITVKLVLYPFLHDQYFESAEFWFSTRNNFVSVKFRRKEKISEIPRNNIGKVRNFGTESNTTADKTWKKDFDIRDWSFNDWTIKFGAAGNNFSNSFQQTIPKKNLNNISREPLLKKQTLSEIVEEKLSFQAWCSFSWNGCHSCVFIVGNCWILFLWEIVGNCGIIALICVF